MQKMIVKGKIDFPTNKLVVSDLIYQEGSGYAVTLEIQPGEYAYYVDFKEKNGTKYVASISLVESQAKISNLRSKKLVGRIMVDVGFAGFFDNRLDYSSDERWDAIGQLLLTKTPAVVQAKPENAFMCNGIVTTAGDGDGIYGVYELVDKNDVCHGYKLRYL